MRTECTNLPVARLRHMKDPADYHGRVRASSDVDYKSR